jgi:hypothetical protein
MGSYFVGGCWSRPMFNARPFALQFTRHEPRIFAEMQLFSAVRLPGKQQIRSSQAGLQTIEPCVAMPSAITADSSLVVA